MNLTEFDNYIDEFIDILEFISMNSFSMPKTSDYTNFDKFTTYGINASIYSLRAIKEIVRIHDYVDCYLIIRKIRDNLIFDCVMLDDALNNKATLNVEIIKEFINENGTFKFDKLFEIMECIVKNNSDHDLNSLEKQQLREWGKNFKNDTSWIGYRQFVNRLNKNESIAFLNNNYLNNLMKDLSLQLNEYTHSLTSVSIIKNGANNKNELKNLANCVKKIKIIFISYLLLLRSSLLRSDDYVSALDLGYEPIKGSQYFIAPLMEPTFKEIYDFDKRLFFYLKENNSENMIVTFDGLDNIKSE